MSKPVLSALELE
ncbi:hypothetical protein Nmel_010430 [Mimus melanotis]